METKKYELTLNRLSKVIERIGVLRSEANQKVNESLTPVAVGNRDVETALARLTETNSTFKENLARTNTLIGLQHYLRGVMMKENAAHGVTDLLMKIEEASQRSKFLDHLMAIMKGGNAHMARLGLSQKDMPRLDDAATLLAEMRENNEKIKSFVKEFLSSDPSSKEVLTGAKALVNNVTLTNAVISPLSKAEVKAIEDEAKSLHRKVNSLHDELSALNARKVNVDLPVDVAVDLGLPA